MDRVAAPSGSAASTSPSAMSAGGGAGRSGGRPHPRRRCRTVALPGACRQRTARGPVPDVVRPAGCPCVAAGRGAPPDGPWNLPAPLAPFPEARAVAAGLPAPGHRRRPQASGAPARMVPWRPRAPPPGCRCRRSCGARWPPDGRSCRRRWRSRPPAAESAPCGRRPAGSPVAGLLGSALGRPSRSGPSAGSLRLLDRHRDAQGAAPARRLGAGGARSAAIAAGNSRRSVRPSWRGGPSRASCGIDQRSQEKRARAPCLLAGW